ncbi:unnamed protein product [Amoebophrya sp. A25]|nr:unnamed protein product [Amoebophrya sp. A25]|eukprot:GSA25T00026659001.1
MGFLPALVVVDAGLIFCGGLYGFLKQGSKASIIASSICALVLLASVGLLQGAVITARVFNVVSGIFGLVFAVMFFKKGKKVSGGAAENVEAPLIDKSTPVLDDDVKETSKFIFYGLTTYNALTVVAACVVLAETA